MHAVDDTAATWSDTRSCGAARRSTAHWRIRRFGIAVTMAVAILAAAGCGGGGGGGAVPTPPPAPPPAPSPGTDGATRVSGTSPFAAGCDRGSLSGTLYAGAEVEPYVAINPRDPSNVVGVWQQDRWSNGGAQGLVTGVSFDGGSTWSRRQPPFTRCAGGTAVNGGDYERATDPWVTIAPDGTAYQVGIGFNGATFADGSVNSILVSRSTDAGRTWSDPVTVIRDGSGFFNDKCSITADPGDTRLVYAVWDRLNPSNTGPAMMSRTSDGGGTWEAPRIIYDAGAGNQTINNQVVVLPDGTLVDYFTRIVAGGDTTLVVIRSQDKGVTWSAPVVIAVVQSIGTHDPETNTPIRDGANLGSIAVDRTGSLAAVWQDSRFSNGARDGIAFARSTDGGLTWTVPKRVNAVAATQALLPTVEISANGTIGVTYYDLRSNTGDPTTLLADYWLVRSTDGVNWTETHVSGPFDLASAPNAGGFFLGDYQALASIGNAFVPFYTLTNAGNATNRTDIFLSLENPVTTVAANAASAAENARRTFEAATAPPLAMTPELGRALAASRARTQERHARGAPVPTP